MDRGLKISTRWENKSGEDEEEMGKRGGGNGEAGWRKIGKRGGGNVEENREAGWGK